MLTLENGEENIKQTHKNDPKRKKVKTKER